MEVSGLFTDINSMNIHEIIVVRVGMEPQRVENMSYAVCIHA